MIEPGLYIHHKSTKLYRVLFVAEWGTRVLPEDDDLLHVYTERSHLYVSPARAYLATGSNVGLFDARWSGNNRKAIYVGEDVVIYVALYDSGRVAARPLKEFEEYVDVACKDVRGATHRVPRFERIGE